MSVKRDVAEATRPELGGAYEGCLDQFERGMSTERLREVFDELKTGLVPLLRAIQDKVMSAAAAAVAVAAAAEAAASCSPSSCRSRVFVIRSSPLGIFHGKQTISILKRNLK